MVIQCSGQLLLQQHIIPRYQWLTTSDYILVMCSSFGLSLSCLLYFMHLVLGLSGRSSYYIGHSVFKAERDRSQTILACMLWHVHLHSMTKASHMAKPQVSGVASLLNLQRRMARAGRKQILVKTLSGWS